MNPSTEARKLHVKMARQMTGIVLRERRERLGLSQEDVARIAGVSRSTVYHMENALREFSQAKFEAVCLALDGATATEVLAERDRRLEQRKQMHRTVA